MPFRADPTLQSRVQTKPQKQQPGFLGRVGKALIQPITDYGGMVGEALVQSGRVLTDPTYRSAMKKTNIGVPMSLEESRAVLNRGKSTAFLPEEDLSKFRNIRTGLLEGSKRSAGAMSYVAPGLVPGAGPGASVAARTGVGAARGAISGALGGFGRSKEGKELQSTAGGTLLGGAIGGSLGFAGAKIGDKATQLKQRAAERAAQRPAEEPSKAAARTFANMFRVSKRKATRDLNPVKTAEDLMRTGDGLPPLRSLDDLHTRTAAITGRQGNLTSMVDEAVAANDQQIPWGTVTEKAKAQMANKLGFDTNAQNDVIRTMTTAAPTGEQIQHMNATQALQYERTLADTAAAWKRAWLQNADPKAEVYYKTYSAASNEAKRLIDASFKNTGIVEGTITPERVAALDQAWPGLGRQVASANTIGQLRSLQAPFVNTSKLIQETVNNSPRLLENIINRGGAQLVGGALGLSTGNPLAAIAGMVGGQAVAPAVAGVAERATVPVTTGTARLLESLAHGGLQTGAQTLGAGALGATGGALAAPATTVVGEKIAGEFMGPAPTNQPPTNVPIPPRSQRLTPR